MQLDEAELITFPSPPTKRLSIVVGEGARVVQLMRHDLTQIAVFSGQRAESQQTFLASEVSGHFLLLGSDRTDPARPIILADNLSEPLPETFVMDFVRRAIPQPGPGYLAGGFPDGVTMVEGVPTSAVIRVHYRAKDGMPGDGSLVAEVTSAQDGSWRVDNLNPGLKFDVICRYDGFNDLILSGVRPVPTADLEPILLVGGFELDPLDPARLAGSAQISGGWGPFELTVEGTPPPGIEFSLSLDGAVTVSGVARVSGTFVFDVVVTDSLETRASVPVNAAIEAGDPYWGLVTSLLRFEDQTVADLAPAPVEWASPPNCTFTEDAAARFNGAGNFLQAATTAYAGHALQSTDDFTIEAFIRLNEVPTGSHTFLSKGKNGSTLNYWFNVSATGLTWVESNNGSGGGTSSVGAAVTWELGKWHHVAVTNHQSRRRLFLDGELVAEADRTGSWMTSGDPLRIGSLDYGSSYWYWFKGDILGVRFTKGAARYKGDFRVPGYPFPLSAIADPSWDQVVSLVHFDDAEVMDERGLPWTGAAATTAAKARFGTRSLHLSGSTAKVLDLSSAPSLNTADFTIEFFFMRATTSAGSVLDARPAVGQNAGLLLTNPGANPSGIALYVGDAVSTAWELTIQPEGTRPVDVWQHVAVVRHGSRMLLFWDGVLVGEGTFEGALGMDLSKLHLGNNSNLSSGLNGYIDEFRITAGKARYVTDFAVPITPFSPV